MAAVRPSVTLSIVAKRWARGLHPTTKLSEQVNKSALLGA